MNLIKTSVASDSSGRVWIGAEKVSGVWSWSDKTPQNYTDWAIGEPDKSGPNNLAIFFNAPSGKWDDALKENPPYSANKFICQCANEGWFYLSHTNKYYKLFNTPDDIKAWNKGRDVCKSQCVYGDLASVPDQTTMNFINGIQSDSVWIGGQCKSESWSWSDGTVWNYTNWHSQIDMSQYTSGVAIRLYYGEWDIITKSFRQYFICQCPK